MNIKPIEDYQGTEKCLYKIQLAGRQMCSEKTDIKCEYKSHNGLIYQGRLSRFCEYNTLSGKLGGEDGKI